MKKKFIYLTLITVLVIGLVAFSGCTGNPDKDAQSIVDYVNAHPEILAQVDTSELETVLDQMVDDKFQNYIENEWVTEDDVVNAINQYLAANAAQFRGAAGPAGKDGLNGADGAPGSAGALGPAGQDGFNGQDGADGVPGPAGPAGPAGFPGATGPAGATGATGPTGAPGFPPPPVYDVNLRTTGTSTATLSTTQSNTGVYSAYLKTDGATGTGKSGTIVLTPLSPMTLAQLVSVTWQEYLVTGYPPHLDVTVNLIGGGTDTLVFEYAYNGDSHYLTEAPMPYGALTGAWYATFSDDGAGPAAVTGASFAWLNSGAAGPYPPSGGAFVGGTLTDWIAGTVNPTIDGTVTIVKLEIEVDNWVVESEAYVDDITVNGIPVYWIP